MDYQVSVVDIDPEDITPDQGWQIATSRRAVAQNRPTQPPTTVVGPLSTDPGPDPVTVLGAAQGVDRGPGAVIGHVPVVRHAGPPLDLHQGATPDPLPAPVTDPARAPVPGPAPAQPGPPINERRALRRHHRQATPEKISEAPSLGRTSSEEEETLHHRSVRAATPATDNTANADTPSPLEPVDAANDDGESAPKKRAVVREHPALKPELDDIKSVLSSIKTSLRFLGESMALVQSTLAAHGKQYHASQIYSSKIATLRHPAKPLPCRLRSGQNDKTLTQSLSISKKGYMASTKQDFSVTKKPNILNQMPERPVTQKGSEQPVPPVVSDAKLHRYHSDGRAVSSGIRKLKSVVVKHEKRVKELESRLESSKEDTSLDRPNTPRTPPPGDQKQSYNNHEQSATGEGHPLRKSETTSSLYCPTTKPIPTTYTFKPNPPPRSLPCKALQDGAKKYNVPYGDHC
ncbi:hypothetical protein HPB49_011224 [Dermacentor silvarum]|uniref:Uncharacterized protein n=1 Tax=Dermacentor silvarum TaxID=543639 RepID=A0ACB8C357_DERSI|nr:hypothetical protein HPB49_011224 [Dermacentor silvarum]